MSKRILQVLIAAVALAFAWPHLRRLQRDAAPVVAADVEQQATPVPNRVHNTPRLPPVSSAPATRILFIGNSLTYSALMPEQMRDLARAALIDVEPSQRTPGGSTTAQHVADPEDQKVLAAGNWNVVVIQDQSAAGAAGDAWVRANMDPNFKILADRARAGSPGVRVAVYMTPAQNLPDTAQYRMAQLAINATYRRIGKDIGAVIVPAGEAWLRVRSEHPELPLYADDRHPNDAGGYLIACVFFGTLFNRSPVGSAYHGRVSPQVADILQRAAWDAVLAEQRR